MKKFTEFMDKYAGVSFMRNNVPRILENLKRAEQNGCLRQFLLNEKPYQSAFPIVVSGGDPIPSARGEDQVALVFALNLYGATCPGFAQRLNNMLKVLIDGPAKDAQRVMRLMLSQMELQELEISLINFVDRELAVRVDRYIRKMKGPRIALFVLLLCGSAIAMPGSAIIGLIPLTFVGIGGFVYSWIKLFFWLGVRPYSDELINKSVRQVGECLSEPISLE